ncbi:MAG: YihY/virulence factor BrkB family protein [Bacteroidota bacterium]
MKDRIKLFIDKSKSRVVKPILDLLNRIYFPGKEKISILEILTFFVIGIRKGDIRSRASAVSFDFFLAIFPAIIFFFTLIPYLPIQGIQDRIMMLMSEALPESAFMATRSTIEDILNQQRGGLLSFGFLFALYVSTNGVYYLIDGFNKSYHGIEVRSPFKQRMVSLFLTLMLATIVIVSIALTIFAEYASGYLAQYDLINSGPRILLLKIGSNTILVLMALSLISSLYYFGPSKKNKRPFISVGSITATVFLILTTYLFNYIISNFGTYNKLYGSIGTLIVILLYINFNSVLLILGFELNASIENARSKAGSNAKKAHQVI